MLYKSIKMLQKKYQNFDKIIYMYKYTINYFFNIKAEDLRGKKKQIQEASSVTKFSILQITEFINSKN